MEDFSQDFSVEFGSRLKDERERIGRSQHAFGEMGGVGKLAQLNYEKGVRTPSVDYLRRLGEHGVDVAYLLTGHRSHDAGIDARLLETCISAVDESFEAAGVVDGVGKFRAQFSALLYEVICQAPSKVHALDDLAKVMVSGLVMGMGKNGG